MAQTNYTPISLYYSTTASAVPTAANLVPGELAINTNDGKLYYEDSSGVVQVLATKSTGSIGGSNTQVQFNNSGSLGGSSSFTWDGTTVTATKFAGALNGTVGATTASTGAFTTLTSNGATTFTAGTASTSTTTGTTVITGGLGVSGRINAANFDGIVGANTAAAGSFSTLSATGVATFSAGTVSLPAITTTGDTNTGIYFPAADTIAFTEGGVESMRIDSSGNLLVGTTSSLSGAAKSISLNSTSDVEFSMGVSGTKVVLNYADATQYISGTATAIPYIFRTNNTERMRIDTSGNLGLGTSSPSSRLSVTGSANIATFDGGSATSISLTGSSRSDLFLIDSGAATDQKRLTIRGDDGNLIFGVENDAVTTFTERMRIDSSGRLLIGTTSAFAGNGMSITSNQNTVWTNCTDSGQNALVVQNSGVNTGSSCNLVAFNVSTIGGGTGVGAITYNGTLTLYTTTSDQRLKTNIINAPSGNIDAIKIRSFNWKSNNSHQEYGMVAQELIEVAPYAVHQPKNPDEMMAVDYSQLVPMMIKEIQDLKQRIATLENK